MSSRPWYKRFPADFIAATLSLSLEEKGAYSIVLDLLYDRGARLPDDPRWIARVCGCSTRRWNQIRAKLIEDGKLVVIDGTLTNHRFEIQHLSEGKEAENFKINGAKGGDKARGNRATSNNIKDLAGKGLHETDHHARCQKLESKEEGTTVSTVADPGGSATPVPAIIDDSVLDIPLALKAYHAKTPDSLRLLIWNAGLAYLSAGTGKPPAKLRPWLGKLCKAHSDISVMAALAQAQRDTPADPIAWIERTLNGSRSHDDDLRAAFADLREGAAD